MQGNDDLSKEIQMARRVQECLLVMPELLLPNVKVAKRCIPAQSIGGDFYVILENHPQGATFPTERPGVTQFLNNNYHCLDIVIGDVAGHGVSSALVMALSAGLIRELTKTSRSPSQALQQANNRIIPYIENSQIPYITVFYARYYPGVRKLEWARAGHPPAILLRDGMPQQLEGDGIFIGMFENETYELNQIQLKAGDRLVFYTDGITEARNAKGEELSVEKFMEILKETSIETLDTQLDLIYQKLDHFSDHLSPKDDQTLVLVEVQ